MDIPNDNKIKYINPDNYTTQLNTYYNNINGILDDFQKTYVLAKMYPENEDYQLPFTNATDNLKSVLSKLFTLSNNIQSNIEVLNKDLLKYNHLIKEEKERNRKLRRKLGRLNNENNASIELIDDYKDIYNIRYLRNWSLLLSGVICIFFIKTYYKKV